MIRREENHNEQHARVERLLKEAAKDDVDDMQIERGGTTSDGKTTGKPQELSVTCMDQKR